MIVEPDSLIRISTSKGEPHSWMFLYKSFKLNWLNNVEYLPTIERVFKYMFKINSKHVGHPTKQ